MKRWFSEEQIIQILREGETAPTKAEVCRKYGISEWTYYRWQRQYRGWNSISCGASNSWSTRTRGSKSCWPSKRWRTRP
jgi:transposase-like protein